MLVYRRKAQNLWRKRYVWVCWFCPWDLSPEYKDDPGVHDV